MDERMQQRTRYLLRSRFRRAQTCPTETFEISCKQILSWLEVHPVLSGVLARLSSGSTDAKAFIQTLLEHFRDGIKIDGERKEYRADTLFDHAAICCHAFSMIANLANIEGTNQTKALISLAGFLRPGSRRMTSLDDALETIRDVALDGLYEYLDEQLDGRNAILGLLVQYKQRCEWLRRERLRNIAEQGLEGKTKERALAVDLYDFVLNQSMDFTIEPATASGQPDLVLREPTGRHVVIDAKYIPEDATSSKIKSKLAYGFHQVARYCSDFEEPDGYLVVFKNNGLRLSLELEDSDGFRFLSLSGRTIYFVLVEIADEPSASKSGKATEITISADDLRKVENVDSET